MAVGATPFHEELLAPLHFRVVQVAGAWNGKVELIDDASKSLGVVLDNVSITSQGKAAAKLSLSLILCKFFPQNFGFIARFSLSPKTTTVFGVPLCSGRSLVSQMTVRFFMQ